MQVFPEKSLKGIAFACLRALALVYVIFGILLYVRQDAHIFIPPHTAMEHCPELSDAEIISAEGTRAYLLRSGTSTGIAITYHGNADTACNSAFLMRWLAAQGFNVLSVEYAGYAGDTMQKPSVDALLRDVVHIVRWVDAGQYSEVLVVGSSVGTGFAAHHALLAPPDMLLLISPFDSLIRLAQFHFPVYPASLMLKTDLHNALGASAAKRVLIVHGTEDRIIPIEIGQSLFDQLPQSDKKFFSAVGYEHNDVLGAPEVWVAIEEFLE